MTISDEYSTLTEGHKPQSLVVLYTLGLFTVKIHGQVTGGCSLLLEHTCISMACNVSVGDHFTLQSEWCDSAQKGNHMRPLATTATAWSGLNGLIALIHCRRVLIFRLSNE